MTLRPTFRIVRGAQRDPLSFYFDNWDYRSLYRKKPDQLAPEKEERGNAILEARAFVKHQTF